MFVIKINGTNLPWQNSSKDDFLRFLPNHFGITKEELMKNIWFLPDGVQHRKVELWGQIEGHVFDLSEDGAIWLSILVKTKDKPDYLDRKEKVELTKLQKWPYDSVGNFKKI